MRQKRKRILSRKRTSIRKTALCLAAVLLIQHIMHLGLLFPIQTVWQMEERAGIEKTRVVDRNWAREIQKTRIAFLSENDEATLFSSCYLTIYGWMPGFGVALDCSEEEPLYAGVSYMNRDEASAWYFFGRVDDPTIQRVEISLCAEDYDSMSHPVLGEEIHRMAGIPLEEQSGRRYFLAKYTEGWDYERYLRCRPVVIGYDSAGNEVTRMEIEDWNSASFG
jgi:hypothetical protein